MNVNVATAKSGLAPLVTYARTNRANLHGTAFDVMVPLAPTLVAS
jgi:hypothetical protein